MRVIFMGTPDFAVGALEAIAGAGHEVVLVVTQPDRPKGRGNALAQPPVKEAALALGLPVYQPKRIRERECIDYLSAFDADLMVVAAFGQILPKEILEMLPFGCVNIHASLLPKYRGASPIQWAVINGDAVSGVTTMKMDVGIDTGDMIMKKEIPLAPDETGGSLFDKLMELGAELILETMDALSKGEAVFTPQNEAESTHVGMIHKKMGEIDWSLPAVSIERLIRGLDPWPSAYTSLGGKTLKIWKARVIQDGWKNENNDRPLSPGSRYPGAGEGLCIVTGDGILALEEVQLEGKKRMEIGAFLRGVQIQEDLQLGR